MTAISSLRVAVITGASSGLGLAAAKQLASQGWRIIGTGRDAQRTAYAQRAIQDASSGAKVDMIRVDLSLIAEAARAAKDIASLTERIDVLINNAGGTGKERIVTTEGNEAMFAGNHLGHFVLTQRLLPLLQAAAASAPGGATRIINVSSKGHETAPGFDWNDLQMLSGPFAAMKAYCNVKLANILFARELGRRLRGTGIVVHAIHPGVVGTNFASYGDAGLQEFFRTRPDVIPAEQAAADLVWVATADEPGRSTGEYFHERAAVPTTAAAHDVATAQRLWAESEKLVAKVLG